MNTATENPPTTEHPTAETTRSLTLEEIKLRALRRWRRFNTAQSLAELLAVGVTGFLGYAVVFRMPQLWLIDGATGGSPRHWILGAAVIWLLLSSFSAARGLIYTGPRRAYVGLDSHWPHALLSALLLWPLASQIATTWRDNDPATLPAFGTQVLTHLAPVVILVPLHAALAAGLNKIRRNIARKEELDHLEPQIVEVPQVQVEVLAIVRGGTCKSGEIVEAATSSRSSVLHALDVLSRTGLIRKTGHGMYAPAQQNA